MTREPTRRRSPPARIIQHNAIFVGDAPASATVLHNCFCHLRAGDEVAADNDGFGCMGDAGEEETGTGENTTG